MKFNREKYLNRINYSGRLDPDINTLRQLQKAHLLNVPFENLDIHLKTAIELDADHMVILRLENGDTKPEYMFKNMGRDLKEFGSRCQYHQSDQRSHFMKKRMISLPKEYGRITLSGNTLKIKQRDKTSEKNLVDEFEFEKALWDNFKISLD